MENFCTLFDSNYLTRGLALISSLKNIKDDFHLYIFAFDDLTVETLKELHYPEITVINIKVIEDKTLRNVKETRSKGEYCWTCTPIVILHCINKFNLPRCTYLDADIFFFSSPLQIINEMENEHSILLTKHNYSKKYDQTNIRGKYCVQFMTFKNNTVGISALEWWKERCIEWCYAHFEDGKFGDQMYLDDWTERFEGVLVSSKTGCGIAPWNVRDFKVTAKSEKTFVENKAKKLSGELIFYHFHYLKIFKNNSLRYSYYQIPFSAKKYIYSKYIFSILESENLLLKMNDTLSIFFREENPKVTLISFLRRIKTILNGTSNRENINKSLFIGK